MVYASSGAALWRALRVRGAGEVQAVLAYSLRQRRHSLSFAYVFQLYGGFLLHAVARTNCALASCRADAAVLSSVFIAR